MLTLCLTPSDQTHWRAPRCSTARLASLDWTNLVHVTRILSVLSFAVQHALAKPLLTHKDSLPAARWRAFLDGTLRRKATKLFLRGSFRFKTGKSTPTHQYLRAPTCQNQAGRAKTKEN